MLNIDSTITGFNRELEERHAQELADRLGLAYHNLNGYPFVKEVLDLAGEQNIIKYRAVPFVRLNNQVKFGLVNPVDETAKKYLQDFAAQTNLSIQPVVITQSSLNIALAAYQKLIATQDEKAALKQQEIDDIKSLDVKDLQAAAEAAKRASTTKLLDVLLICAIKLNASDIHFEPVESSFMTRYRVDGVLQEIVSLPTEKYRQLIARLKYLSSLRLDITDKPQDGRFTFSVPGEVSIDFRLSIMPSAYGESVVLRILNTDKAIMGLDLMGFRSDALAAIREAISKPHGMVITSGPTGSGKSTTLYAILMELKVPGVKIITLEDPVEYKIEGIEQSQVKPGAGYEFADGLRASMRQDPDILMVGEIRDLDTAEIAVQAALTGHLLLSTIHANSAPAVYARFIEIGVKPFLLSGSINLIMAQRLVRRVCSNCATEYQPDANQWKMILERLLPIRDRIGSQAANLLTEQPGKLKKGAGCEKCGQTGYSGREVIVEFIVPNEMIESLIAQKASIMVFEREAMKTGMITMEQDGLIKALEGSTTIDEVWRVTKS